MREIDLRNKVVNVAKTFLGYNEKNGQDDIIIRKYNQINSEGMYDMNMNDSWCAAFGSVVGNIAGLSNIIPIECSCQRKIDLWKKLDCWDDDGSSIPKIGDYCYYNWDDNTQPNDGWADHEGIVTAVTSDSFTVIEGNNNDAVNYRTVKIGWGFIRGFGRPNYKSLVATDNIETVPTKGFALGSIVEFTGNVHYTNSYASGTPKSCTSGQAEITSMNLNGVHKYHLVGINGCSVHGWVNEEDIKGFTNPKPVDRIKKGDVVTVINAVTYTGKKFKLWHSEYDVIQVSGDRAVIGKGKEVTCAINVKHIVKCKK